MKKISLGLPMLALIFILTLGSARTAVASLSAVTATSVSLSKSLSYGETDPEVADLQMYLMAHGYLLGTSATTYYGAKTRAAVRALLAANGISSDGSNVGPKTRAILSASAAPAPIVTVQPSTMNDYQCAPTLGPSTVPAHAVTAPATAVTFASFSVTVPSGCGEEHLMNLQIGLSGNWTLGPTNFMVVDGSGVTIASSPSFTNPNGREVSFTGLYYAFPEGVPVTVTLLADTPHGGGDLYVGINGMSFVRTGESRILPGLYIKYGNPVTVQ